MTGHMQVVKVTRAHTLEAVKIVVVSCHARGQFTGAGFDITTVGRQDEGVRRRYFAAHPPPRIPWCFTSQRAETVVPIVHLRGRASRHADLPPGRTARKFKLKPNSM